MSLMSNNFWVICHPKVNLDHTFAKICCSKCYLYLWFCCRVWAATHYGHQPGYNLGNAHIPVSLIITQTVIWDNLQSDLTYTVKVKGKAIPCGSPQGSVMSRLPHFLHNWLTDGGEDVSLMHRLAAFYPQEDSLYSFLLQAELNPGTQWGWKDWLKNVGASTSHNPMGLPGPSQE